ncbi:MAG: substrate-binding domain-containing protein [Planctomycetota bacterium]
MKTSAVATLLGLILAVLVGAPLIGRLMVDRPGEAAERLVIVTPHNEQIRYEMARAFNLWRESQGLEPVQFDWRVGGGTSDLRKTTLSQFHRQAKRGKVHEGVGVDLFFGGGTFEHGQLASAGFELAVAWAASGDNAPALTLGQGDDPAIVLPARSTLVLEAPSTAMPPEGVSVRVSLARPPLSGASDAEWGAAADVVIAGPDLAAELPGDILDCELQIAPAADGDPAAIVLSITNKDVYRIRLSNLRFTGWTGFAPAGEPAAELEMAVSTPAMAKDDALLLSSFPEAELGGFALYDADEVNWIGVAMSSFGIVYSLDAYERLGKELGYEDGLPHPTRWSDLARPELRHWVALANPSHSSSIRQAYNILLQRTGWTEGWGTLRRAFANARYFTTSSTKVPLDVSKRDAAAGMCIDFYGRFQASDSPGRVAYVDPWRPTPDGGRVSLTFTEADPISMLRGAPNREVAKQFVRWLLTPEGQLLWQLKVGAEGGPEKYELRRQPIRKDLYGPGQSAWADAELDAFDTAVPFSPGTPRYFGVVSAVASAMAIDVHNEVSSAWDAILDMRRRAADDPALASRLAEMEQLFDAMPEDLTLTWPSQEIADNWQAIQDDPGHPQHEQVVATLQAFGKHLSALDDGPGGWEPKRREWRDTFFRPNYARIVELGAAE